MGCKWCTSGLGRKCHGPNGIDDLECGCECDCHKCPDCGSAYCINVGGEDECDCDDGDMSMDERYTDDDDWIEERKQ